MMHVPILLVITMPRRACGGEGERREKKKKKVELGVWANRGYRGQGAHSF